jgi:CheY-like chemotaxis protein
LDIFVGSSGRGAIERATASESSWQKTHVLVECVRRHDIRVASRTAAREAVTGAKSRAKNEIRMRRQIAAIGPALAPPAGHRRFARHTVAGRRESPLIQEMAMPESTSTILRHAFGAPLPPRRDSAVTTKQRILVVEDDAVMARVLGDTLTGEGFAVEWIPNGELLLEKVRTFSPDLVMLDVSLPRRDGFELCLMLRRIVEIPVLMLSARSQSADRRRGLGAGADDYVTKPFDLDDLMTRIRAVLRRRMHAIPLTA